MIATSTTYDIVFLVHILAALATLVVFITLHFAAKSVASGADAATQKARFPQRRNWAARVLHLLPVTGLIMSLSGDSSVSLAKPWIGVGLLCYLAAAGHLEARTLPQERVLAEVIAHDGTASIERGKKFLLSVDILLGLVGVALVAMVIQF